MLYEFYSFALYNIMYYLKNVVLVTEVAKRLGLGCIWI